jgi:hypothetical protein
MQALSIHAGPRALDHLRQHGLQAQDVAVVPAAAGGPKGLILQALDQWLFGHWLPCAPRPRTFIGASIGAWRMAAASQADPARAFARLGELYCEQRYTAKPSPQEIDLVCQQLLRDFVQGHEAEIVDHPHARLHLIAARGKGWLAAPQRRAAQMGGFGAATMLNIGGRHHLARMMERVIIGDARDRAAWLRTPFDAFTTHFAPLSKGNLAASLLASGTLPLVMDPVRAIDGAPPGTYWDGGMIDYHLALPYALLADPHGAGLVLYPHFSPHIVPGWLDKAMPWRRAARGPLRGWLDNVVLVAPTPEFVRSLPRAKLPDRQDFPHYGLDHDGRIRHWQAAMAQGQRLRDEFAAFVERPDPRRIVPL